MSNMYSVTLPKWFWTILMAIFVVMLGGTVTAAGWVTTSLIDHERRISIGESELANTTKQLDRIEGKLDRLLEQDR